MSKWVRIEYSVRTESLVVDSSLSGSAALGELEGNFGLAGNRLLVNGDEIAIPYLRLSPSLDLGSSLTYGPSETFDFVLETALMRSSRVEINSESDRITAYYLDARIAETHEAETFRPPISDIHLLSPIAPNDPNEPRELVSSTNLLGGQVSPGKLQFNGEPISGLPLKDFRTYSEAPSEIWLLVDENYVGQSDYEGFPEKISFSFLEGDDINFGELARSSGTHLWTSTDWRSSSGGNDTIILPTAEEAKLIRDELFNPELAVNFLRLEVLGHEAFFGGAGNDTIDASHSISTPWYLYGESGDDTLIGGRQDDALFLGSGENTLTGGAGADYFKGVARDFDPSETIGASELGKDTITDFERTVDKIDVSDWDAVFSTFSTNEVFIARPDSHLTGSAGQVAWSLVEGGTLVEFDTTGDGTSNHSVMLQEVEELEVSDFIGVEAPEEILVTVEDVLASEGDRELRIPILLSKPVSNGRLVLEIFQSYEGVMPPMNGGVAAGDIMEWAEPGPLVSGGRSNQFAWKQIEFLEGVSEGEFSIQITPDEVKESDIELYFGVRIAEEETTTTDLVSAGSLEHEAFKVTITDKEIKTDDDETPEGSVTVDLTQFTTTDEQIKAYLKSDIEAAAARIYDKIPSLGNLNIMVLPDTSINPYTGELAEADDVHDDTLLLKMKGLNSQVAVPLPLYEDINEIDISGGDTNSIIKLNPDFLILWYDGSGGTYSKNEAISSQSFDIERLMVHEILHTLGVGSTASPWDNLLDQSDDLISFELSEEVKGVNSVQTSFGRTHVMPPTGQSSIMVQGDFTPNQLLTELDVAILRTLGYGDTPPEWLDTGANEIEASEELETHDLNNPDGEETIKGNLDELDGDTVLNFDTSDKIIVAGERLTTDNVSVTFGSAILKIDADLDGEVDSTIILEGDFEGAEFNVKAVGGNTEITFTAEGSGAYEGTNGPDKLLGSDGHDEILGKAGHDEILGLFGNDVLKGNRGDDTLFGGGGRDELFGGRGADLLFGNSGIDTLSGGKGSDTIFGGQGDDEIKGGRGLDLLNGGRGADDIRGGQDSDFIYGRKGSDTLSGGRGADSLVGGKGNDLLFGGGGSDTLVAGKGNDTLFGGHGTDEFFFRKGFGSNEIEDFDLSADLISIGAGANRFEKLEIESETNGAMISFKDVSVLLKGVDPLGLTEDHFVF